MIKNSETSIGNHDEIITSFCQVCHNLMDEMILGGELFYTCPLCGSFNKPFFLNTNPKIIKRGTSYVRF